MPTPPSASGEYRGNSAAPTLQGETFQFGEIESLIYGSSWRGTRLDRVSDRQHLQGEYV
jgi:hypothetical protein